MIKPELTYMIGYVTWGSECIEFTNIEHCKTCTVCVFAVYCRIDISVDLASSDFTSGPYINLCVTVCTQFAHCMQWIEVWITEDNTTVCLISLGKSVIFQDEFVGILYFLTFAVLWKVYTVLFVYDRTPSSMC